MATVEDVVINQETPHAVETKDEEVSDEEANEADDAFSEHIGMEIEKGARFLCNSEAIVEFREGLIDFRIGVENARQNNQILYEKDDLLLAEPISFQNGRTLASNLPELEWSTRVLGWPRCRDLVRDLCYKTRKALRRRVKPGTRRIEWTCVSKLCAHGDEIM